MLNKLSQRKGFTLLEVLIALFIFTILSMILMRALHSVIGIQAQTEQSAKRLTQLQITLLMLSRDVEQAVNRPIINASGKQTGAFLGTPKGFEFTHLGVANPNDNVARSAMQRTEYHWHDDGLWRTSWSVLDQAPTTQPHTRLLLGNVDLVRFQYLDKEGHFQDNWPKEGEQSEPLPRGVKVSLTIAKWGAIDQFYVIAAEPANATTTTQKS